MFSPLATDHIQRPRNQGPPPEFTHYGVAGEPGEGPYAEIWLTLEDGIIRSAHYRTPGCPSSVAASSVLCEVSKGREFEKVKSLTGPELLLIMGGLPEGKEHFAGLAIRSMQEAKTV